MLSDLEFLSGSGRRAAMRRQNGYSLIEVMISVVLGLILIGSVLALVISVLQSNAETVRNTRLSQELRTLLEVVGREAERARLMADPIAIVGNPPSRTNPAVGGKNPNSFVDDDTDGCLRFAYAEPDGSSGTNNTAVTLAFRNGALFIGRTPDAALQNWTDPDGNVRQRTALMACADANVRLSSPEIQITAFVVEVLDDADVDGGQDSTKWINCNSPDSMLQVRIDGRLAADTSTTRSVTDRIRIGAADLKANANCY